jgi:hypothetical protein
MIYGGWPGDEAGSVFDTLCRIVQGVIDLRRPDGRPLPPVTSRDA